VKDLRAVGEQRRAAFAEIQPSPVELTERGNEASGRLSLASFGLSRMTGMAETQSLKNHARTIPAYHYFVLGILAANGVWTAYRAFTDFSGDRVMSLLVALALVVLAIYARVFALTVQDRVIRNEMRERLRQMLPPPMHSRIDDLTVGQLVALRFASDAELPELCTRVLNDRINDRREIKKMIKNWRADLIRA